MFSFNRHNRMKKRYFKPAIYAYFADNIDLLSGTIPLKSEKTEGLEGWGNAQSKGTNTFNFIGSDEE